MTVSLERVFNDKRFRIGAAVLGVVVLSFSAGLLIMSSKPMHKASTMVASVLPETAYNLPILRSLPDPQPMLPKAGRVAVETSRASAAASKAAPMIARRR